MKHKVKRKSRLLRCIAGITILGCLLGACAKGPGAAEPSGETRPTQTTLAEGESDMSNHRIQDLYVDKARYMPGEEALLTVELEAEENAELELQVRVRHIADVVFEKTESVRLQAGEPQSKTLTLPLPADDFTAYSVEAYLLQGGETVDCEMTAAEVASDWSRFPRYGYLTKYGTQSDEQIRQTIERLNKYHITGLFFYDVLDCHEKPLAGTVEAPEAGWKTLSGSYAAAETVSSLIDYGHEHNMNSYLYNLIFGAYDGYEDSGVKPEWGLYKDTEHRDQDYHGDFADSWETKRLYLFNPANKDWQDYYLKVTKDVLDVYHYDGLQIDSLGSRGSCYDYSGGSVDLKSTYASLLNRLNKELGTRVIFNPVSGYGQAETLKDVDYDIIYEEVWPWDGGSYGSLKFEVDMVRSRIRDDKGISIAAYMNYKKQNGAFNMAGILLTDATLMASGASHLELGDTGMLKNEYYPGTSLRVSDKLEAALRNYYSFSVAYENYLRDPEFGEIITRTYVNDGSCAQSSMPGKIWSFTRQNDDGEQVLNFINLIGVDEDEWVDNYGKQKTPEKQVDLAVKHYVTSFPTHVYFAAPDCQEGILRELPFETGEDENGKFTCFIMPSLEYWDMVILK